MRGDIQTDWTLRGQDTGWLRNRPCDGSGGVIIWGVWVRFMFSAS